MSEAEKAELRLLRKFRDSVNDIATTDYFTGKLSGFLDYDDLELAKEKASWKLVSNVIKSLRDDAKAKRDNKEHTHG